MKIKALVLLLLLVFPISALAQKQVQTKESLAPLIPMKDFFRNPTKVAYQISPNGEYLAYLQPWESRLNVFIEKIGSGQPTRVTSAKERDIAGYAWKGDNRIVYIQDTGGDENYRLYAVGIDGSNPKDLTPFEKVRAQFIDRLARHEKEILVGLNKRVPQVFDVYRINVNTGEMQMIAENPGNYTGWATDWDGKLRIAITTDGVNNTVMFRNTEADKFAPVITTSFKETITPLLFTPDNKQLYVATNIGRDKTAIVKYDVENKKELEKIYEHLDVDVTNLLSSRKRRAILGVSYNTDKTHYYFIDKQRGEMQKDLERRLPGYEVRRAGCNLDEDKGLVPPFTDRSLGAYYFYDLKSKDLKKLGDVSPWLNEQDLAPMKPIKYQSRDGLTINGYLTLPKGVPARNLPVVVNPHGGPWYRDQWGYNPEVQFLANRGYAVLQMNFRGSTGYGRAFWEAGFRQWGKKMQDDVTGGVRYAVAQGIGL